MTWLCPKCGLIYDETCPECVSRNNVLLRLAKAERAVEVLEWENRQLRVPIIKRMVCRVTGHRYRDWYNDKRCTRCWKYTGYTPK